MNVGGNEWAVFTCPQCRLPNTALTDPAVRAPCSRCGTSLAEVEGKPLVQQPVWAAPPSAPVDPPGAQTQASPYAPGTRSSWIVPAIVAFALLAAATGFYVTQLMENKDDTEVTGQPLPTDSPDMTASPQLRPSPGGGGKGAVDPKSAFVPLSSYEYQKVRTEFLSALKQQLYSTPGASFGLGGFAARQVTRDGQLVAFVMAISIREQFVGDDLFNQAFVQGFESESEQPLRKEDIAGKETYTAVAMGSEMTVFYKPEGLWVMVVPIDPSVRTDIVRQLITG